MPKQNRKRKHLPQENDIEILAPKNKFRLFDKVVQAEEEHLSNFLFGSSQSFLKSLEEVECEMPITLSPDSGMGDGDSESSERTCVWSDEDDIMDVGSVLYAQNRKLPRGGVNDRSNQYSNLLKHKFEDIMGSPKWAALKKEQDFCDSDDDMLQTCGFIAKTEKQALPPVSLEFKKLTDLNYSTRNEGIINCIEFHPMSTVALVAGKSGILSLFAVDGKNNYKLHNVSFDRFPILSAKFVQDGNEAILGSRQQYIYSYDLIKSQTTRVMLPYGLTQCKNFVISPDDKYMAVAGKWGDVHILSTISKERICLLKQDSDVTALSFNSNGSLLYGHSTKGEVAVWDMNMRRIKHKWTDEGCLKGSTLALAPSNQFVAAGSNHGIVNLYGVDDVLQSNLPKPRKTLFNLTTDISNLQFNPTSEIVAFASTDIENSVRLFHIGTGSVFSNFPPFNTKLGNITAMNFSPGSGYAAFGNKKGTVALYRLKHFKTY